MQMTYLNIPSNSLLFAVCNALTNPNYQQNLGFLKLSKKETQISSYLFLHFRCLNCPTLLTISVKFWKWKYFFFKLSLAIPCKLSSGIHQTINFTQKIEILRNVQQQKSVKFRDILPGDSWPYTRKEINIYY